MSYGRTAETFDRVAVMREKRRLWLLPETRKAVRPHQLLFLKGFCFQLGGLVAAFAEGAALDPFHSSSPAPLVVFLMLLAGSVAGTVVELVAMHRREPYVADLARGQLRRR